jgi:hypothetical protein
VLYLWKIQPVNVSNFFRFIHALRSQAIMRFVRQPHDLFHLASAAQICGLFPAIAPNIWN